MWIVCLALRRTYTFGVLPVRIAILGAVSTNRMATDVLPEADVSVVSIAWQYSGMLPMSLGLGEGGEQNVPLGRAVIGGMLAATVFTLFFVPVAYSLLRRRPPAAEVTDIDLNQDAPVRGNCYDHRST